MAQSLCGVLTALLLARIACIDLGADRRLAAALACLLALDPAQLFYERMVMAESLGTLNLIAMIACGFAYLRRQWWPWLLGVALFGIATVALRMSLLPVVLEGGVVDLLFHEVLAEPGYRLTIDLPQQAVLTRSGKSYPFHIDAFRKHNLVHGLDEIGLTLAHAGEIRAFEERRRAEQPWLFG